MITTIPLYLSCTQNTLLTYSLTSLARLTVTVNIKVFGYFQQLKAVSSAFNYLGMQSKVWGGILRGCGTRELFDVPPDNPEPQRWRKRENAFSMLAAIQIA